MAIASTPRPRLAVVAALLAILVIGCRGDGPGVANPTIVEPKSPASGDTTPVRALVAYTPQTGVVGNAFGYDVTIGGTAFTDPRRTGLTYSATFAPDAAGLRIESGRVWGVPLQTGVVNVTVTAADTTGRSASQTFTVNVLTNAPIEVTAPLAPQVVTAGAQTQIDLAPVFSDPRGTGLTYTASFDPPTSGWSVSDGYVVGTPPPSVVRVTVTATDSTLRHAATSFVVIAFGADLTTPHLPATPYTYSDAGAPLPAHLMSPTAPRNVTRADNTPANNRITDAGAALGRVLFYDRRLSANDRASCSSCHLQEFGFSDTAQFSRGFAGAHTTRQAPSLTDARFYERGRFFLDERAATLEALTLQPIQSPVELGMTLDNLLAKLSATTYYRDLFQSAFGSPDITTDRVSLALAQFVRALTSTDSKFDRAFATNTNPDFRLTLTQQEFDGRQVFLTIGRCEGCHSTNAQISFVPRNNGLDVVPLDPGAGQGKFKAPSLRNIGVTAPYMHDGRFKTLEEVIEFYNSDVQDTPGLDPTLRTQDGPPVRMHMTPAQSAALAAYLRTLTDYTFLSDSRFADPFVH